MNFKKVKLMDMERCYAVTTQYINGRKMLLAAAIVLVLVAVPVAMLRKREKCT